MKYFDLVNQADDQYDQVQMRDLGLKQHLYISNEEKEQVVTFFQKQVKKLK